MIMETQIPEINTVTKIVFESCFKLLQHNIIAQIILFIILYLIKIYCALILLHMIMFTMKHLIAIGDYRSLYSYFSYFEFHYRKEKHNIFVFKSFYIALIFVS